MECDSDRNVSCKSTIHKLTPVAVVSLTLNESKKCRDQKNAECKTSNDHVVCLVYCRKSELKEQLLCEK